MKKRKKISYFLGVYRLGMWRVQYLQRKCCICHVNLVASSNSNNMTICNNLSANSQSANNSSSPLKFPKGATYFFRNKLHQLLLKQQTKPSGKSKLVCSACHNDMDWLPPRKVINLSSDINRSLSIPETINVSNTFLTRSSNNQVRKLQKNTIKVQSAVRYDGYIRAAIIAFKYKENLSVLPVLVHALRQLPKPKGCCARNSVILAMPTTTARMVERGFNPVRILAMYLSEHWQIPLWHGVRRIDNVISQQGLSRKQRLQNMHNAFAVNVKTIPAKKVILFDDVVTTGTTLQNLVKCLYDNNKSLHLLAYTVACVDETR